MLGRLPQTGAGTAYLAEQLAFGRCVVLDVVRPDWARNPVFLSRFLREAYTAAQLDHPNIAPLFEIGEARGISSVCSEYVDGPDLAAVVESTKRLDARDAAAIVLQAARGLEYAHYHSFIHRGLGPTMIQVDRQGAVKVTGLGLVCSPKLAEDLERRDAGVVPTPPAAAPPTSSAAGPSFDETALGDPAYIAPELARDAVVADHRADVYSLGCTLYALVTGQAPFGGRTAAEIIAKHQTEPMTPPELIVPAVPKGLSEIIQKMTAKRPEDRFANFSEVIRALEGFLGVPSTGSFQPRAEDSATLELAAEQFQAAPTAPLRWLVQVVIFGLCTLLFLVSAIRGWLIPSGVFLGLGVLTAAARLIEHGLSHTSPLFQRARAFVLGGRLSDWLTWFAGLLLVLTALWVFHYFWVWAACCVIAIGAAIGLRRGFDDKLDAERSEPLAKARELIARLRRQGVAEDDVRRFVATSSGRNWEEFFEALFGYDAKRDARRRWGPDVSGKGRPKYASWREPIVAGLDAKIRARQRARDQELFEKLEEKRLCAQGVNLVVARRKAWRIAEALVTMADQLRAPENKGIGGLNVGRAMRDAAQRPETVLVEHEHGLVADDRAGFVTRALGMAIGPRVRFLAGAFLLAGCLIWMHQNQLIHGQIEDLAAQAAELRHVGSVDELTAKAQQLGENAQKTYEKSSEVVEQARSGLKGAMKPLEMPILPAWVTGLFTSFGPGAAGLLLIVSAGFRGWKMSLFALPAAVVAIFGPGLQSGSTQAQVVSIGIACAIAAVGWFLGRER